jgi:PAS domain S-box-containing protein
MSLFADGTTGTHERLFLAMVEGATDSILLKDARGRVLMVNRAGAAALRRAPEEIIGNEVRFLFEPSVAEQIARTDRLVLECGETLTFEQAIEGKVYLVTKSPWRDETGRVAGVLSIDKDITDWKRAEQALKASEARWRAMSDSSPLGIFMTDAAGQWIYTNHTCQRLLGLALDHTLGLGWLRAVHADDRVVAEADTRAAVTTLAPFQHKYRFVRGDGSLVWVSVNSAPIWDGDRHLGFVGSVLDITDHRRAQDAMQARTRELETLLSVASHDLREPLRAMSALTGILRDDYGSRLDDEGRDLLARILAGTQRMDELIEGVALLVRAQKLTVARRTIDGRAALADALQRLESTIARQCATITINGPFPIFRAEKAWVVEVLYHLIGNALKFTVDGVPPMVEIAAWQAALDPDGRDGEAGFVVRDRGPGVPADSRERIFNLFRRAVGRQVPGTGVGLAIVREVAERHRGRAFVRPREGGGSEFVVTFGTAERFATSC